MVVGEQDLGPRVGACIICSTNLYMEDILPSEKGVEAEALAVHHKKRGGQYVWLLRCTSLADCQEARNACAAPPSEDYAHVPRSHFKPMRDIFRKDMDGMKKLLESWILAAAKEAPAQEAAPAEEEPLAQEVKTTDDAKDAEATHAEEVSAAEPAAAEVHAAQEATAAAEASAKPPKEAKAIWSSSK